jgi:gamma-aminobutyric acid type B receptor
MVEEDEGDGPVHACMAIPWLYSVGFSITFGTLFAKIRRVYGIFAEAHRSAAMRDVNSTRRAYTSYQDTVSTIGKVLLLDVVILVLWTSAYPLHWKRDIIRQDQFGFTLESQGNCTSENWRPFLGALVALHITLCIIACYMCYVSRNIPSRYSEHKYLTIAMVSNLQVFAIGGMYDGGWFACTEH